MFTLGKCKSTLTSGRTRLSAKCSLFKKRTNGTAWTILLLYPHAMNATFSRPKGTARVLIWNSFMSTCSAIICTNKIWVRYSTTQYHSPFRRWHQRGSSCCLPNSEIDQFLQRADGGRVTTFNQPEVLMHCLKFAHAIKSFDE